MSKTYPSTHVPTERLKSFLLEHLTLTEEEHCHLMRCTACVQKMAEATLAALDNASDINLELGRG